MTRLLIEVHVNNLESGTWGLSAAKPVQAKSHKCACGGKSKSDFMSNDVSISGVVDGGSRVAVFGHRRIYGVEGPRR